MSSVELIEKEIDNAQIIILNRLDSNNKLSIDFMKKIAKSINDAISYKMRSIIITNQGEYFCGGGELGNYTKKTSLEIAEFGEVFINLHKMIYNSPIPIIAAVKGKVMGGGFSFVEACDFAVASEESTFCVPEIKSGIAPMMALVGVKNVLTKKKCYELALLGKEMNAREAQEIGLINKALPMKEVQEFAIDISNQIASSNPSAIKLCKELYASMDASDYEAQLNKGLLYLIKLLKSSDAELAYNSKGKIDNSIWENR